MMQQWSDKYIELHCQKKFYLGLSSPLEDHHHTGKLFFKNFNQWGRVQEIKRKLDSFCPFFICNLWCWLCFSFCFVLLFIEERKESINSSVPSRIQTRKHQKWTFNFEAIAILGKLRQSFFIPRFLSWL